MKCSLIHLCLTLIGASIGTASAQDLTIVPISGHTSSESTTAVHGSSTSSYTEHGSSTVTGTTHNSPSTQVYVYLRCNSTSWDLTDANRMLPFEDGYALINDITDQWMVDSSEACVFSITDQLNTWTKNSYEFVAKAAMPFAQDSQSYGLELAAESMKEKTFRMKYNALGSYIVFLNLDLGFFTVMPTK